MTTNNNNSNHNNSSYNNKSMAVASPQVTPSDAKSKYAKKIKPTTTTQNLSICMHKCRNNNEAPDCHLPPSTRRTVRLAAAGVDAATAITAWSSRALFFVNPCWCSFSSVVVVVAVARNLHRTVIYVAATKLVCFKCEFLFLICIFYTSS